MDNALKLFQYMGSVRIDIFLNTVNVILYFFAVDAIGQRVGIYGIGGKIIRPSGSKRIIGSCGRRWRWYGIGIRIGICGIVWGIGIPVIQILCGSALRRLGPENFGGKGAGGKRLCVRIAVCPKPIGSGNRRRACR